MNDKFTWDDHAGKISQRIFIGLRNLWPLSKHTPLRTRCMLAKSLLLPHLDYCSAVFFYGLDAESMRVLNRSIESIARYVYGLGRSANADSHVTRLLGCSLVDFLRIRLMCYLFKLDRTGQPAYLKDILSRGHSARSLQFVIPRFTLSVFKKTLFVKGIVDYNSIPVNIRMVNSLNAFRARCLELFNRRSNPSVYE